MEWVARQVEILGAHWFGWCVTARQLCTCTQ